MRAKNWRYRINFRLSILIIFGIVVFHPYFVVGAIDPGASSIIADGQIGIDFIAVADFSPNVKFARS